jgi:putative membrane protein
MKQLCLTITMMLFTVVVATSQSQPQSTTKQQDSKQQQSSGQQSKQTASSMNNADQRFVSEAAQAGMAEVAHGQLAVQRASNQEVKSFAQRMIDDHSQANQELMQLATSKGISLPSDKAQSSSMKTEQSGSQSTSGQMTTEQAQLKGKHREAMNKLAKLSGAEFDREYMRHQVKDHDKAIALFEGQANRGGDADLKAFAAKTLPKLREHQQMAQSIAAKAGASETKTSRN